MDNLSLPRILLHYCRERVKLLLGIVVLAAIFSCVFYLYNLPLDAVLYAALLSLAAAFLFLCADFYFYYRRARTVYTLWNQIDTGNIRPPESTKFIDAAYCELVAHLLREKQEAQDADTAQMHELLDYCALWTHQIKTPIAALRLMLPEDTAARLELFKVERYAEAMLTYLRLPSISSDLALSRCDLDKMIRETVKKFAPFFIAKQLRLNFTPTGLTVLTDEKWLALALEQLISNAVKYTDEGEIAIWAEGETLHIRDTGVGIASADLPRVFERGFTGANGRLDKRATGIGLFLVKCILSRLQNDITLTSTPGEGTEVTLDLSRDELLPD